MKISIVMANYNRRQLLINTLKTIEYYNIKRDIEVIVVDDNSCKNESIMDVPELFKIPVIVIPITKEEKSWTWDGIVFNIGFCMVRGDMVIIQNPENLHVGDIVGHALKHLKEGVFLSYALYSMNQQDSDNLIKKTITRKLYSGEAIKKAVGKFVGKKGDGEWTDGDTCWYNHSKHRPSGCHLISAITRKDLEDLHGFDERYYDSFAHSDSELHERIKRKRMTIRIIDEPFAIHQRHDLSNYKENEARFQQATYIFSNVTMKEKIYRAPQNFFYRPTIKKVKLASGYTSIDICPISDNGDCEEILNLGEMPLVNRLCDTREEALASPKYPLTLQVFSRSRLTCLTGAVDKKDLFRDYVYSSGVSRPFLDHCSGMFDYLSSFLQLKKGDYVYDIGGNDGSLLKEFKKKAPDLSYVNIEASNQFSSVNEKAGITYINTFFDEKFLFQGSHANLIISTNVLQHTAPIRSFVKGINRNLRDNGVWCLEFPYFLMTVFNDNYDQVYHEHVYYFNLFNIIDLLASEWMRVIHASFHNIHTGTLRVLSVKSSSWMDTDRSVQSFLNLESSITPEYLAAWGSRIQLKIQHFKTFLAKIKSENKTVIGFGAAAKGCVFLSSTGVDYKSIPVIIDDTPGKQGKYMPGTGIFISDRSVLKKMKVDYILILAHNFSEYIMKSLEKEYSGKFIIMFPDIKII